MGAESVLICRHVCNAEFAGQDVAPSFQRAHMAISGPKAAADLVLLPLRPAQPRPLAGRSPGTGPPCSGARGSRRRTSSRGW